MLKHVRQAGLALGIVDRAGVHVGMEGDNGRFVPLENNEMQTVPQRELSDVFFEFLEVLRRGEERHKKKEQV